MDKSPVIAIFCFMAAIFYSTTYLFKNDTEYHHNLQDTTTMYSYSMNVGTDDIYNYSSTLPTVLPNYKNPCWLEPVDEDGIYSKNPYPWFYPERKRNTLLENFHIMHKLLHKRCKEIGTANCWRIRCFPYFFFIGSTKAGTSDLYYILSTYHPQIEEIAIKESQFWPRRRHIIKESRHEASATFAQYLDLYDSAAETIRRNITTIDGKQYHTHIVGDFTPANYYMQYEWWTWPGNIGQPEPRVILAHLLYHIRPQTKFIFCVRDPVTRAISNINVLKRYKSTLEEEVKIEIAEFNKCRTRHTVRYCVYTLNTNQIVRGMYAVFLKDWMEVFPRDQIFVNLFEEYVEDRAGALNRLAYFLEIGPVSDSVIDDIRAATGVNQTKKKKEISDELIKMLQDFYRPWNEQFAQLMGDDKYLWGY